MVQSNLLIHTIDTIHTHYAFMMTLSELDTSVTYNETPMTLSELDTSVTYNDPPMTLSELATSVTYNETPMTLSELATSVTYNETPMTLSELDTNALYDDELMLMSELELSDINSTTISKLDISTPTDELMLMSELELSMMSDDDFPKPLVELISSQDDPLFPSDVEISMILNDDNSLTMLDDSELSYQLDGEDSQNVDCNCAICLESINKDKNIAITECGHKFCFQCIGKTLVDVGNNCPLCRRTLIEINNNINDDDDEESIGSDDTYSEFSDTSSNIDEEDNITYISDNEEGRNIILINRVKFKEGPVNKITERFLNKGYTYTDLMTIVLQQYEDKNSVSQNDANKCRIYSSIQDLSDINNQEQELFNMEKQDYNVYSTNTST